MTSTGGARPLAITYGEYDGMQPERAIIDRMDDDVATVAIYFTKPATHASARNRQERHLTRLEEVRQQSWPRSQPGRAMPSRV